MSSVNNFGSSIVSKKVKKVEAKVVGEKSFINPETGEVETFNVISKKIYSDTNFHKVWLADILSVLDLMGSAKLKVFNYLLGKMNPTDNTVYGTYRAIAKDSGISYGVVAETIKIMLDANILSKIQNGVYRFNPNIIIKGSSQKRQNLMIKYQAEKS